MSADNSIGKDQNGDILKNYISLKIAIWWDSLKQPIQGQDQLNPVIDPNYANSGVQLWLALNESIDSNPDSNSQNITLDGLASFLNPDVLKYIAESKVRHDLPEIVHDVCEILRKHEHMRTYIRMIYGREI